VQPNLVIFSAQLLHTASTLKEVALTLQAQGIMSAFGGSIFNQMPELHQLIPGHFLGQTVEAAVQRVSEVIAGRPPLLPKAGLTEIYAKTLTKYSERRALLEAHVWGTFIASNKSTKHLMAVNYDMAEVIIAALKLGDVGLLEADISWIEHLLLGYRLPKEWIVDYMVAYYQAAKIHLGESAHMIVEWLSQLVVGENSPSAQVFLEHDE
jgi:hypothetical protein